MIYSRTFACQPRGISACFNRALFGISIMMLNYHLTAGAQIKYQSNEAR